MKPVRICVPAILLLFLPALAAVAGGAAEGSSGTRTEYLAERGQIAEPAEVEVSQFISAIDYGYPEPEGTLGVYAYPGQYQLSMDPQELVLCIGVQAARRDVEELPPLNVVFVVDTSGSMADADKIAWVRDSLEVFADSIRPGDTVSLVSFANNATVLLPTTRVRSDSDRRRFLSVVRSLAPGGGTNLYEGLELGFAQLLTHLSSEYVNRIVLLSDGLPTQGIQDPEAFRELAQGYRDVGISISAIGLGAQADLQLIGDIAHWSSGTSRFINDRQTMREVFGYGLGRTMVPVAMDVMVNVRLAPGVRVVDTWGYDHQIVGSSVSYTIPALHDSDYETMVAVLEIPESRRSGEQRIATVDTSYRGGDGRIVNAPSTPVAVDRVNLKYPVVGVTNALALRAATMLRYGQVLEEVGRRYYDPRSRTPEGRLSADVAESLLALVTNFRFEMENAELRLDKPLFTDELTVLASYQNVLAEELRIAEELRRDRYERYLSYPPVPDRPVSRHVDSLVAELRLSMLTFRRGAVAVLGFTGVGEVDPAVQDLLFERTYEAVRSLRQLSVLSPSTVTALTRRRGIASADIADAALAADLGRELGADYVVTGMLISSPRTFHFFERVIRTSDGEVLSAAQVMVPR